jgi:hypothetical protein
MRRTYFCLMFLFVMSVSGFAQINKHSFGGGITNGVVHYSKEFSPSSSLHEERMLMDSYTPYAFGFHGSFLNTSNKWFAWKTSLNIGTTVSFTRRVIPYNQYSSPIIYSQRTFWGDVGFGPLLTYVKDDYGFFIGVSLDLSLSGVEIIASPLSESINSNTRFNRYPYFVPAMKLGYWQRMGNINSPWYLEVELVQRDMITTYINLFDNYRLNIHRLYAITIGFRYEIKE